MQFKAIFAAAIAAALAACNPVEVLDDTTTSIDAFHQQWADPDVAVMWRNADPEFRELVGLERFETMIVDFREILGDQQSSERENFTVNSHNGTTVATVVMRTQFANGEGLETFVFRQNGERMQLAHYAVQSPLLDGYDWSKLEGEGFTYEPAPDAVPTD
ncbi:MAG: hypothetical protein AAGK01_11680 [Pseudomonadota bacterium]